MSGPAPDPGAPHVEILDTTLRDGTQAADVVLDARDKVRLARHLDRVGVDFVEGGWPGSNPRDRELFHLLSQKPLERATLTAFGSTARPRTAPCDDPNLQALVASGVQAACIFGKAWDFQVERALDITPDENLAVIGESVRFLKLHFATVIFDAEHFFDGLVGDEGYALAVVEAAAEAGADRVVLCDTNGGSLPQRITRGVAAARTRIDRPLGIHCHDDGGLAVANTLAAVLAGARHVQGTVNGLGERCGNADWTTVVANLALKLGFTWGRGGAVADLTGLARQVDDLTHRWPDPHRPYTGSSAFAHKGGVHVSAVLKDPACYEHVDPEALGNRRRFLVSDLSGRANLRAKAAEWGIDARDEERARAVLTRLKEREAEGWSFEQAEASLQLLAWRMEPGWKPHFEGLAFRATDRGGGGRAPRSEARVQVRVGGQVSAATARGEGPVHALDVALRQVLLPFYPQLETVSLRDYRVRVLPARLAGTASPVQVQVESDDGDGAWGTVGVSTHIIAASFQALADAYEFKLRRDEVKPR